MMLMPLCGCSDGASPIPSHVTAQEMKVYVAWLQSFQKRHPERRIELASVTMPIPQDATVIPFGFIAQAFRRDGMDVAAFNELARQGEAFYPMSEPFDPKLVTLRSPRFLGDCAVNESRDENVEVALVNFSRVVFHRKGNTAFLRVTYSIRRGDLHSGGGGFYTVATQIDSGWNFKTVGPVALF
jgi:hypothetical protein